MFAKTTQLTKDAYTAGKTLYGFPTTKMNKLQKLITRRAYLLGVTDSALATKEQSKRFSYKMEPEIIVPCQMTLEDNARYNKVLFK